MNTVPTRLFCWMFLCVALFFGVAAERVAWAKDVYQVGVARVDVTPDYPIRLNGFGFRREESEGVTQRIWAKALAVSYGDNSDQPPILLVTLDSLGVRLSMVDEVASRLKKQIGLPRENLALTFSHSHTTPKVNGACDNIFSQPIPPEHQQHIDRYTTELTNSIEQVCLAAAKNRRPAQLEWSVGTVKFAKNRRAGGGPVDHSLPVLLVRDLEGEVQAVYTTYACHAVTLSHNKISGDWTGYAQEMLERKFPGAMALVSIGCGSDSNPLSGPTGDKVDVAAQQGSQIADEVARLATTDLKPITGKITARLKRISLPLQGPPIREELEAIVKKGGAAGYNAQTQLARLDRSEKLLEAVDYPIQTITFGDSLHLVFLAGEVCVDYALRLRQELDAAKIWLHGYSNDFCCYIPSERLAKEGGYGGGSEIPYFALPSRLQGGLEQKIIDEVKRQTPQALHVAEKKSEATSSDSETQGVPPKSPEQSLRCMKTHDDLHIELVVAEPLIADPVAIDFGPDGKLWVVEMTDYAHPVDAKFSPQGRVRFVRDTDGNGRYDRSTIFAEGLRFPTDVKVWRDGLLVCDAPEILYFEDADGDGRAEIRKTLFSGFVTHNPHARVNSLRYALDNWVYGSGGLFGGVITSFSGQKVDVTGRDFRMNPDTGQIESAAGRTQQGRSRDDWDNWFGCSNGTLLRYYPIADHYFARNPHIAPPDPQVYVPDYPNSQRLYPLGDVVLFKLSGSAGRPTSACGLGIYRDRLLGSAFVGNTFTCEPVNQLVHRQVVKREGAVFKGHRAAGEQQSEFLASTDRWFRPVQVRTGLDGAVWIVDMYRYVIEHPRWIPDETKAQINLFAGQGRGRIYRVTPKNGSPHQPLMLSKLDNHQLVQALDSPNGPHRDLVQQLLVWRKANEVANDLEKLVGSAGHAEARLQAACTLEGLGCLQAETVSVLLNDSHSEVRRHAVRLSEPFLNRSPVILEKVLKLVDDPATEVRLQLAYSLGECNDRKASSALAKLGTRAMSPYVWAAALSSVRTANVNAVMAESLHLVRRRESNPFLQSLLSAATAMGDEKTAAQVVAAIVDSGESEKTNVGLDTWRMSALSQVLAAARRRQLDLKTSVSQKSQDEAKQLFQLARRGLKETAAQSDQQTDRSNPMADAAVALLGQAHGASTEFLWAPLKQQPTNVQRHDLQLLVDLLSPQTSQHLQTAVVTAISNRGEQEAPAKLLAPWASATPSLRTQILDALLSRTTWTAELLAAIKRGELRSSDLDAARRQRLLSHSHEGIRSAAKTAFSGDTVTDRGRLVQQWQAVALQLGDENRGKDVFKKRCANCHKMEEEGVNVGPDLQALTSKSAAAMLVAILDPSRDVDARYLNYLAVRDDGRGFAGLLENETANSITIREPGGKETVLLRSSLEELQATGKSVMPDGLEKDMTKEDMADVIAYVMSVGPPPKTFPGNKPVVIEPAGEGQLTLAAATAEIFGDDIRFESDSPFQNIGHWHGEHDRASWRVNTARPNRFEVYLDWSCSPASAGNGFRLEGGGSVITGVVESTGGWEQYRQKKLGEIELPPGPSYLSLHPDGKLTRRALLDLRAMYLVPIGGKPRFINPTGGSNADSKPPIQSTDIARLLLDDSKATTERQKAVANLIEHHPQLAAKTIAALVADLTDDAKEEYRRIPWIWRVAIASGKRAVDDELTEVLRVSLPQPEQPLKDWQAVVIGGGVINGLSQAGIWPKKRIEKMLAGDPQMLHRWHRSIDLAAHMAGNHKIRQGTRYDALRMIAMASWDERGPQLVKYLAKGIPRELQMGAVSGLSDVRSPQVAPALLSAMGHYSDRNRELALDALLRTSDRATALMDAIAQGKVDPIILGADRVKQLRNHSDEKIRAKAQKVLE